MKKNCFIFILLFSASMLAAAQDKAVPDLAQMNSAAKNPYAKVEELDKLQQDLKYFDEHIPQTREQQQSLLETYRSLANGYSANNHFKQGYSVYQKYLGIKESFLLAEKTEAISKTVDEMEQKQSKDEQELTMKQNEIQQLELDNKYLEGKRKSFKQYFSFGVIALTVLFSVLLLQAGLRLTKIRHDLKAGRERLKVIHRTAALGRLKNGIFLTVKNILFAIHKTSADNLSRVDQLQQQSAKKTDELNELRKQMNEIKSITD
jgi:hypothetical protein